MADAEGIARKPAPRLRTYATHVFPSFTHVPHVKSRKKRDTFAHVSPRRLSRPSLAEKYAHVLPPRGRRAGRKGARKRARRRGRIAPARNLIRDVTSRSRKFTGDILSSIRITRQVSERPGHEARLINHVFPWSDDNRRDRR